jgi:cytochrome oxidase Cu insertion factor (SCO1/SenC/PrrC family)
MPTAVPPKADVIVDQPEVGTVVGKTVPHFEFTLIDGTKRSTAQLASQGKPVFLFFFATW